MIGESVGPQSMSVFPGVAELCGWRAARARFVDWDRWLVATKGPKKDGGIDVDAKCGLATVVKFMLNIFSDVRRCGLST